MTESIINALVHLFAIIESVKEDQDVVDSGELVVKPYLSKLFNQELTQEYLKLFYDYLSFYQEANNSSDEEEEFEIDSTSILQVAKICNQLNKELLSRERILVFMQLLELINTDGKVVPRESEFIALVAMNFNLVQKEVDSLRAFIIDGEMERIDAHKALIIDNKMIEWPDEVAWMMRKKKKRVPGSTPFYHMYVENLFGKIMVLHVESVDIYVFKYDGPLNLYLEGNRIIPRKFYLLKPGSIIKGPNIGSIYESQIIRHFLEEKNKVRIVLTGENLEFHFRNSSRGIQKFSFSEESGNLIGIMGGSGVGKSTLMNLLNGKLQPTRGRVHINGHSIHRASHAGVIGFVPQDDLLFEELTVYQNLYFNAQICFSDFSEVLLERTVNKVLDDLDLLEIKDLKVGDPLNKFISGGQRKRLNIALELMREPSVLYVDEPTSGLSSMDSEKVMQLLKNLARSGKLVIAILHQPSSDIFKLLDKLWILDKGGYPIYNGNPVDAVVYFKTMSTQVNAAESECPKCGNVIPEQILQIIEAHEIDDAGKITHNRRVTPLQWYQKYKNYLESGLKNIRYEERLPPSNFHIPTRLEQFQIYFKRNLLSKLSNTQYILINLLEAPVLALILGYFSKYAPESGYTLMENKNLPVYLFMAVVVALFMGMSVSAEEIFKDRRILARESFLNLSRFSYINSKVFYLFALSAVQTLTFIWIGNFILEIKGMTGYFWCLLFSISCVANMIGLNISSALNSVITIYILIPFILVPQLLLGGAMIKFDELHQSIARQEYVPVVGDLMPSRWAYEALVVAQFHYNPYERPFFYPEMSISQIAYQKAYVIPEMQTLVKQLIVDSTHADQHQADFLLLTNEYRNLHRHYSLPSFPAVNRLQPQSFDATTGNHFLIYLDSLKSQFQTRYKAAVAAKDSVYAGLVNQYGSDSLYLLKKQYYSDAVSDLVQNKSEYQKIIRSDDHLIQKKDPVFMEPYLENGRAHFFAPYKKLGFVKIPTFYFNLMMLWLSVGILYLLLWKDVFRRLIYFLSGDRWRNLPAKVNGSRHKPGRE